MFMEAILLQENFYICSQLLMLLCALLSDTASIDNGSIAGICVAAVTIIISVVFIIISTMKAKAKDGEDIQMKEGENGAATSVSK